MTTAKVRTLFVAAVLSVLVMPLSHIGPAGAMYLTDGSTQVSPGVYANPSDGFCVSGIKTDGTMTVVPGITNFRDCVAYTTGLTGMTATDVTALSTCSTAGAAPFDKACNVAANCARPEGYLTWVAALQKCFDTSACTIQGASGNDGAKHTYSASLCINAVTRAGISRFDLDNTAANCQEKGGVLSDGLYGHPYGACSAYGWIYGGVQSNGMLPNISGGKGVTSTANLGFCYASMRMTSVPYTVVTCPSQNNLSRVCAGGANVGKTCTVATQGADCPASTCVANSGWTAGTDGVLYQSQASYDAGLGWTFASNQCVYAYGVKGYLAADLRGPDGAIAPAVAQCGGGTVAAATAACVDLTGVTSQGDCLAIGGTWDNWLPIYAVTNPSLAVPTTPQPSTIVKLDATTAVLDPSGHGGKFYSNTGSICTKCHTDQSRQTIERYKPGFVETLHKKAGDDPDFATIGTPWGLKGVQCEICHATGKPTAQDLGVVIYPTKICVGGTEPASTACDATHLCASGGTCTAGVPRGASGHNQTEYGTHVIGVCFTCHGTAATPESVNPASVIPVSGGDFALNSKNLAPIANEFLNSPHAEYAGSSNKLDIITKTNFSSTFAGKICRGGTEVTDAATAGNGVDVTGTATCGATSLLTCNSATNCPATPGGNRVWNPVTSKCYDKGVCAGAAAKTWDAGTNRCVESQPTCVAQSASGYNFVWSPTGVAGNPSIITTSGAGCYSVFGNGTIYATYWDSGLGAAEKIPFLDTATNLACTSPTAGAGAFWTADGEGAGTSGGVAFPATDKGHCMTCHDMHWSLESTDPEAEPIRRECTTCHSHPTGEASVSGAPQIDIAKINHSAVKGTPMDATKYDSPCEVCHMAIESGSSSPLHLWRINTDPAYSTMGGTQANLDINGKAWVDLDHACGQCHFPPTKNGAPPKTKAELALIANGIHDSAGVTYPTTFSTVANGLTVNMYASVTCNGCTLTYVWDCGVGGTLTAGPAPGDTATCTYTTAGTKSITLTVMEGGGDAGTATRAVTLYAPVPAPVPGGLGGVGCPSLTFNADKWQASFTDSSTPAGAQVTVEWGDGSVDRKVAGQPFSHKYRTAGSYLIVQKVIDNALQLAVAPPCTVSPLSFTIDGHVYKADGVTGLGAATVSVRSATTGATVRTVFTDAFGFFQVGSLKADTYWVVVAKRGYTFPAPTSAGNPAITVGPSSPGNSIKANP